MNTMHQANRRYWDRATDSRFWQDYSHLPGTDDSLLDWNENPRAALLAWLALASQKPFR